MSMSSNRRAVPIAAGLLGVIALGVYRNEGTPGLTRNGRSGVSQGTELLDRYLGEKEPTDQVSVLPASDPVDPTGQTDPLSDPMERRLTTEACVAFPLMVDGIANWYEFDLDGALVLFSEVTACDKKP